jgi:6-pyruvoyltetrahydropterin/6-carboxytetrahydropterin synthase
METWTIYKEFRFEAAHRLPNHDGKCQRLHGHSWVGRLYLKGHGLQTTGPKAGMLLDYGDVKEYLQPLLNDYLDHHYLNDTTGLANPTSEALSKWIFDRLLAAGLPHLYAVEIRETCTSSAYYHRSQEMEPPAEISDR